jgi:signal peptidase I
MDDSVGKGQLIKRKELLKKVSIIAGEIRAIETPISETNLEKQPRKPDWVEIENEKHNLEMRPKDKDFERILQELHTEATKEESCKNGLSVSNVFVLFIIVCIIIILSLIFYRG